MVIAKKDDAIFSGTSDIDSKCIKKGQRGEYGLVLGHLFSSYLDE